MVGPGTLTPVMLVRIQTPEPDPFRDRLMVGQQTLNLHIEVRILAPEPTIRDSSNGRTTVSEAANRSSNLLSRTSKKMKSDSLILRRLTEKDFEAFKIAYTATSVTDPAFAYFFEAGMSFQDYRLRLSEVENGINLPIGFTASTMYWGFVGDEIVGRLMLRFQLNEKLLRSGGNIGYIVVPQHRQCGVATKMLQLVLPIASEKGLSKVLLTCDEKNTASRKVIEKCGGLLQSISFCAERGYRQCSYWIPLSK